MKDRLFSTLGSMSGALVGLALLAGNADAAPGVGVATVTAAQEWGPYSWGPGKSTARLGFYLGTTATMTTSNTQYASIHTSGNSQTWADAYLFGSRFIFWDIQGRAITNRGLSTNPDQNKAYARGRIVVNNTVWFSLTVDDYTMREAIAISPQLLSPKNTKIAGSKSTFWVGPIPVTVSGELHANAGILAGGIATMAVNPNDPAFVQFDANYAAMQAGATVWGQGWAAIGDAQSFGVGAGGNLTFFNGTITPEAIAMRGLCNMATAGCGHANRVATHLRVRAPINITTLSGRVYAFASEPFGGQHRRDIINWNAPVTYNTTLWDKEVNDVFAGFM